MRYELNMYVPYYARKLSSVKCLNNEVMGAQYQISAPLHQLRCV
jgi:hypothetical protein